MGEGDSLRILKEINGSGLAFRAELPKDGAERLELARAYREEARRGRLGQSSEPAPQRMDSIAPTKLASIAHDVAFELRLPWRIEELRAKAVKAYPTARRRIAGSGLSPKQADKVIRRLIYGQVKKAGEGRNALPFGEEKPAPERIEAAFGTFTAEQWETLLESFGQVDVEALLSFIHQDADRLKQNLGVREVGRIKERASLRENVIWVEDNRSTLVPITDPFWAVSLEEEYRLANIPREGRPGKGRPGKGRSLDEERRPPSMARRLSKVDEQTGHEMKVSAYEVGQWRNRAKEVPFEQYVAEVGADDEVKRGVAFIDYWAMIRNSAAFKKYLDAHKHRKK